MSYDAQLANITPEVIKAEKWALQGITHIPHNAFPNETFLHQQEIGMRSINPLQIITAMIEQQKSPAPGNRIGKSYKPKNEKGPC